MRRLLLLAFMAVCVFNSAGCFINIYSSDPNRRILELRFLEANSLRETARAMNVSLTNAKVLQHRALHRAAQLAEERR